MKKLVLVISLCLFIAASFAQTAAKKYPVIDLNFKKYTLDNGLTLIVHEDHKAPIIAFNVWYHVGSKNEKQGKTGFAHLFEHLMFNGSEHFNDDYFKLMDQIGATDLNGTTNNDRTNYFENFPVEALDKVLWIESDRMGFLQKVIDSARLSEQRGVVQNEKREGENQPYAVAEELTVKSTYPAGHPYSWSVIGSMEDLNAASLDDVKDWFKTYYGPNNAVICMAGDIKAEEALEKVKKYFGNIPASPPIAKLAGWTAKMIGNHYQVAQDRVPQARIQKTWNIPGWGKPEMTYMNLLLDILTNGKTSRLYKRLVYDDQLSSNVFAYTQENEIGGQLNIFSDAKPGLELNKINDVINEELKKVLATGVTAAELERAKTRAFTGLIKGIERIGGFGGKSDILIQNEVYGGSPDYYKKVYKRIADATPANIKDVANTWLTDGEYRLDILPYGDYAADSSSMDRNVQPPMGASATVKFPEVKEFTLSNGLKVSMVERKSVPIVNMSLMVDAGYAADQFGLPGLASLTGRMLTEGTKTKTSLQISDLQADLGASIGKYSDLDKTYLTLDALKTNFEGSLNLFTDILLNPAFPKKDFDRVKKEQLLSIKQEQAQPVLMGLRILPKLLYGNGHAYSNPFTGSGTEESVSKIMRDDLIKFHQSWFVPNNSTLTVVGDITADELKTKLEKNFAGWKAKDVAQKNISEVALPAQPVVYIIDKSGALQSIIFAAEVSPSAKDQDYEAIKMMNKILGGEFTSRVNMNLREDKHWSYGAFTVNIDAKGPSFFTGYAPVQTDKTKESIVEMQKELTQYVNDKPVTDVEFNKVRVNSIMQLPGTWETNNAVLGSLQDAIKYNRGIGYLNNYPTMLQNMQLPNIVSAAKKVIKTNSLTWVIVGDRSQIEKGIQELNLGVIKYIDSEGKEAKR
ncbi:MAG: pitrilysin family protein [Ferruginibacter sp.]